MIGTQPQSRSRMTVATSRAVSSGVQHAGRGVITSRARMGDLLEGGWSLPVHQLPVACSLFCADWGQRIRLARLPVRRVLSLIRNVAFVSLCALPYVPLAA